MGCVHLLFSRRRPTFKFSVQPASWASATNSSRKRDTISSGSGTQLASALTLQRIVSAYLMREALSMHPVVVTGGIASCPAYVKSVMVTPIKCNQAQSNAIKCNRRT